MDHGKHTAYGASEQINFQQYQPYLLSDVVDLRVKLQFVRNEKNLVQKSPCEDICDRACEDSPRVLALEAVGIVKIKNG